MYWFECLISVSCLTRIHFLIRKFSDLLVYFFYIFCMLVLMLPFLINRDEDQLSYRVIEVNLFTLFLFSTVLIKGMILNCYLNIFIVGF